MKKILSIITVLTGFIIFTAQQTDNNPEFKFKKETHDFGKVPAGKPVSVDFIFTNTGDAPLIISTIESTCGCTVPKFTAKPVLKGGKGIITVTFNAVAVQAGFTKAVTIKSNARTPSKMLYIKGEVVPAGN
jgi:hypothetical protein